LGDEHVVGAEARVNGAHFLEAAEEVAGYGQQHKCDGNFGNDQR